MAAAMMAAMGGMGGMGDFDFDMVRPCELACLLA
jgi:hypothetical protein